MDSQIDVMVSLHVQTMKESASIVKRYLEKLGLVVWICTEDLAGTYVYSDWYLPDH
jgi:hypothetical protein